MILSSIGEVDAKIGYKGYSEIELCILNDQESEGSRQKRNVLSGARWT
jgi:hypothetical protein